LISYLYRKQKTGENILMLDLIRRKQHTFLIKVIFWVIIAAFVGTGMFVWGGGDGRNTPAVTINGTSVDFDEYQRAYSNLYRLYQEMYRETFTPEMERQLGLRRQALDLVIDQTLLTQEAARRNITVSRQELIDSIAQIPSFQDNGVFNRERYLQVLSYQRLKPELFEEMQRRQLLVDKVRQQIINGVNVTDQEIEQEFRNRNEQVNLAFLRLTPSDFETQVQISEDELQTFFEERREAFRTPEMVSLQYLIFDPAQYTDEVTLSAAQLASFYQRNFDRFEIEEEVKASHILIGVSQDASQEMRQQKREETEAILSQVREGSDFAELARKHSDDPGSASQGGDLGYFGRGMAVAAFEQVAFSLQPGQISNVVETPFGFHIIKVEDRVEGGLPPLADVEEDVRAAARAEEARKLAFEKAMDAYNMHRREGRLEAVAESTGLQIRQTGFFDRQGRVPGLGDAREVVQSAFALQPGEMARPVFTPEGVALYALKERSESRIPELSEIRRDVETAYRREKAHALARESAGKALASLKEGRSIPQVARTLGTSPQETGFFSRAYGGFVPGVGLAHEISEQAFSAPAEQPVLDTVFEQDGTFIVAVVKEQQKADSTALEPADREELRRDVLARKRDDVLEDELDRLRADAKITIAPTVASSIEGERG
jgi:peptidyl-prolyl cis-trans isomerase D